MELANLFEDIPEDLPEEQIQQLLGGAGFSLERIVSRGHSSGEEQWYDQQRNEWVVLLRGAAELQFSDGRRQRLEAGDFVTLAAHERHRVAWTDPQQESIWLALHYDGD